MTLLASAARAARDDAANDHPRLSRVQHLIAELGNEQYAVRRRAEEQLLRLGPEAFDELKAAEDHRDLEIADRVRYIVQRMRVQWIRPDDPPEVRRLLTRYSDLSENVRGDRIRQLAQFDDHAGLLAICRIARFDQSPLVARKAAAAILDLDLSAAARRSVTDGCLRELGSSSRPPVVWIQLYLHELDEPREVIAEWAGAMADEAALLKKESGDTDFVTVYDLLERHLDRCHELKLVDETAAALLAIVDLTIDEDQPDRIEAGLAWALRWVITHEQWDVLARLEDRFEDEFRRDRKLLYYLAAAAGRAGRDKRAAELAHRAFNLADEDEDDRVTIAEAVAELGFVDWAEREYRRTIEMFPVIDHRSMEARSSLAIWLHDREDYQEAADLLGAFCDAIDADRIARQRLIEEIDLENSSGQEIVRGIAARREFYLACVEEAHKNYDEQRQRLEVAAKKYDKDPDILIAMYHSPGADEDYHQRTRARIRGAAKYMQALIDEYPDIPSFYNQWAWLIANTEGDQELAVEYSRRSLELSPEEPSYLDTLARCYYAVGDLQEAVKSQRRAVELAPHYRIMRRQLEQFERALAAQSAEK